MVAETTRFTRSLPVRADFRRVLEDDDYEPVPEGWLIALTDVAESRKAIAAGRYKDTNVAGVAMISAIMNALDSRDVPFIFAGDGSAMVCAPEDRAVVEKALARTVTWVREEFGLTLRAAIVPVETVRAAGLDVRIEVVRVSDAINNYAFRGGGISHAEELMKAGRFAVAGSEPGAWPDLQGLSCRWSPLTVPGQKIVSVIIEAQPGAEGEFRDHATQALEVIGLGTRRAAEPMRAAPLGYRWPPPSLGMEARLGRGGGPLWRRKVALHAMTLLAYGLLTFNIPLGRFDPRRYKDYTVRNTDFRKFQDGLRVTVALGPGELERLTAFLEKERSNKKLRYGLCVQDSAILTCYVPSVMDDAHMHFLDGAGGGYAAAADNMQA